MRMRPGLVPAVLGVLAALAVFAVVAAGGSGGGSARTAITGLAAAAIAVGLAAWWLHEHEHRLHAGAGSLPPSYDGLRPHAPVARVIGPVVIVLVVGLMLAGAVNAYRNGRHSADVQSHGLSAAGTVDDVVVHAHYNRHSTTYTSDITVGFSAPVLGVVSTDVHYPDASTLTDGDAVTVLVDRHDPGYAELPGSPSTQSYMWLIFLGFAVLFGFLGLGGPRLLQQRRLMRPPTGPGQAVG